MKNSLNYLKKFWNYLWHDDSFGSYILNFLVAFVFIKYLFFPGIGLVLNNDYPVVAIVSGSMEHKVAQHTICNVHIAAIKSKNLDQEEWWGYCGEYYQKAYNQTLEDYKNFKYPNGLNIGDVMILYGKDPKDIEVGEVLVYEPRDLLKEDIPELGLKVGDSLFFNVNGPVIHRVTQKWTDEQGKIHFQTKGDHNPKAIGEKSMTIEVNGELKTFTSDDFERDIGEDDIIGVAVLRFPLLGYAKVALTNGIQNIKLIMG